MANDEDFHYQPAKKQVLAKGGGHVYGIFIKKRMITPAVWGKGR